MFALEIVFTDGVSEAETLLVRRPQALLGASDYAHVVIDDMKSLDYQLRLVRGVGRSFRTRAVSPEGVLAPDGIEGKYEGQASLDLGNVTVEVVALDIDLTMRDDEPPDSAGVRILRQACAAASPKFPALVLEGAEQVVTSFAAEQPIYIGRSKQCALRLDAPDISARHARLGFEKGQFWLEDLGSTNGTFVNQQQISGRVNLSPGAVITLGHEVTLHSVASDDELRGVARKSRESLPVQQVVVSRYPVLVSTSEVARPARLVVTPGASINVGRDPSSDFWLGAPYISRRHFSVRMEANGNVLVNDHSTNGTGYEEGVLRKGNVLEVNGRPRVFDLGNGLTVGLCWDEREERAFLSAGGSPNVFSGATFTQKSPALRLVERVRQTSDNLKASYGLADSRRARRFVLWLADVSSSWGIWGKLLLICGASLLLAVLGSVALLLGRMFL